MHCNVLCNAWQVYWLEKQAIIYFHLSFTNNFFVNVKLHGAPSKEASDWQYSRTPLNTDTSLLQPVFFVPRESPYIVSKFNPLNTDTIANNGHLFLAQSTDSHRKLISDRSYRPWDKGVGGWAQSPKNFSAPRVSVWSKNKEGERVPGSLPCIRHCIDSISMFPAPQYTP